MKSAWFLKDTACAAAARRGQRGDRQTRGGGASHVGRSGLSWSGLRGSLRVSEWSLRVSEGLRGPAAAAIGVAIARRAAPAARCGWPRGPTALDPQAGSRSRARAAGRPRGPGSTTNLCATYRPDRHACIFTTRAVEWHPRCASLV